MAGPCNIIKKCDVPSGDNVKDLLAVKMYNAVDNSLKEIAEAPVKRGWDGLTRNNIPSKRDVTQGWSTVFQSIASLAKSKGIMSVVTDANAKVVELDRQVASMPDEDSNVFGIE